MLKAVAASATGALPCVWNGREGRSNRHQLSRLRIVGLPSLPRLEVVGEKFVRLSIVPCGGKRSKTGPAVLQMGGQAEESQLVADGEPEVFRSIENTKVVEASVSEVSETASERMNKMTRRQSERRAYLFAAIASTTGFTALSGAAVFYRFFWQMQGTGEVPYDEILGTFALAVGTAVGMEYWARWAHKALWHASLWHMHESHHLPRDGPFELNDIFAIINAVPAIALMLYGFLNHGLIPGLCFGAGLGITMFGIAYMFVHDGLVHRRFPVGPVADVPYLQKVAAAHQLHHADKYDGVPYGLFLGPQELDKVGGTEELDRVLKQRLKSS